MMKGYQLLDILDELAFYYMSTRGVGHTTVMREGALAHPSAIVIAATQATAENSGVGRSNAQSIYNLRLRGLRAPLALDNSAIFLLVTEAASRIREQAKTIEGISEHIHMATNILRGHDA